MSEHFLMKHTHSHTQLTNLCWEWNLDASLQNVVSGDLNRSGQLQVLYDDVKRNLREHLLDLMSLMRTGREHSKADKANDENNLEY